METTFLVNGYEVNAEYQESEINGIFLPLLKRCQILSEQKKQRVIVFLAAPPGAGKTTLLCFLEQLAHAHHISFQGIGLDGFHRYQDYLKSHKIERDGQMISMVEVKGCPETFDEKKAQRKIQELLEKKEVLWPYYDRVLHDPKEDQIQVNADIVMIEGNYLLLDEENWRELKNLCDYSIFVECDYEFLKNRLIGRKAQNTPYDEAVAFVEKSDKRNAYRILEHRLKSDETWHLDERGYSKV